MDQAVSPCTPAVTDRHMQASHASYEGSSPCCSSTVSDNQTRQLFFHFYMQNSFSRLILSFVLVLFLCLSSSISSQASKITRDPDASFKDIAIAQTKINNVNIRKKASTDSDIVGKLPNNCAAVIKRTEKGADGASWYYVKSGSVTGYIKASFCVTGSKAKKVAENIYGQTGEVIIKRLRLRKTASSSASVLAYMLKGSTVTVLKTNITGKDGLLYCKAKYKTKSGTKKGYAAMKYYKFYYSMDIAVKVDPPVITPPIGTASPATEDSQNPGTSADTVDADTFPNPPPETVYTNTESSSVGVSIATQAYSYVNELPYVYGGTSLTTGADCSGFTQSIYRQNGVSIPRTSVDQAAGGKTISASELQIGDLVFYTGTNGNGTIGHVAIFVGYGKIVHEANTARGCQLDNLNYTTPVKYVTYLR